MFWRRKKSKEQDLERELRADLELEAAEQRGNGLSPEQARLAAQRAFGNTTLIKEDVRESWGWTVIEQRWQDLRYATRGLRKAPGFTTVAVLCLALGIGTNTAIFSLIDAVMLRSLPVKDADRLVSIGLVDEQRNAIDAFSYPQIAFFRENARRSQIFAYGTVEINLSAGVMTDAPSSRLVSDNYFAALSLNPPLGRAFVSGDQAVVMISYRYWKKQFHGATDVIGRNVALNGLPFTLIGVTPENFFGVEVGASPDIFIPLAMRDQLLPLRPVLANQNNFWLNAMARLQPGVSAEQAHAELEVLYHQIAAEQTRGLPAENLLVRYFHNAHITVAPGDKGVGNLRAELRNPLFILMAIVALVLLTVCANLASLLLARAMARKREIAVRLALGGRRSRVITQLLTESGVLSAMGGMLGLVFAFWGAAALAGFLNHAAMDVAPDTRVFSFALAATIVASLLFGIAPALQSNSECLLSGLKSDGASRLTERGLRLREILIVGQVAISLLGVIGAALFIRTFTNLKGLDTGFRAEHVLLVSLNPGLSRYSLDRTNSFYDELLERTKALPGVDSASIADQPLLDGAYFDGVVVEGRTAQLLNGSGAIKVVTPGFFESMGIPIRLGRDFSMLDRKGAPRVAIVNEALVRKLFGGENALGKRIGVGTKTPDCEIVGVIADTKYRELRAPVPATVYLPIAQQTSPPSERTLHVRTSINPDAMSKAIETEVHGMDRGMPIDNITTFSKIIDAQFVRERLTATLSGFFGVLMLLLTAIGIYGALAYNIRRRTREIGIRMSLGAERRHITWMVLRDSLLTVILGIAIGLPLSLWLTQLVREQWFGIRPNDPAAIAGSVLLLIATAAIVGYLPARKASRVDPAITVRSE